MNSSFDMVAVILYVIFGAVVLFLISFLFDIKKIFSKIRTHTYVSGPPEHKNLQSSEGIIIIKDGKVSFRELFGEKDFFSIPVDQIVNISTGREGINSSNRVLKGVSNLFAERDYLFIECRRKDKSHTLQFSTHRTSPVNDEIKKQILKSKEKILIS